MSATISTAWPVRTLGEQLATLLKAAENCREKPDERHVHKLRTTSRRIEGQLLLLHELPGAPRPRHAKLPRRLLKRVRRDAGEVRDLDVQVQRLTALRLAKATTAWRQDRDRLCALLKAEREEATAKLLRTLRKESKSLKKMAKRLAEELKPHEAFSIAPAPLGAFARTWFAGRVSAMSKDAVDQNRLHGVRKAAKLARYMTENAPKSRNPARKVAAVMEELQLAGGDWHDLLTLKQAAVERLGESSPLVATLRDRCLASLAVYQRRLRAVLERPARSLRPSRP